MDLEYITSLQGLSNLAKVLPSASMVGLDVETTTLDPYEATLLLLQLSLNDSIFVLDARKLGKKIITYIVQLIKDSGKLIIGHNLKFDTKILYHNTGEILVNLWDTMLAETMIYNGIGSSYISLEDLYQKYFGITLNKEVRNSFIGYTGEITQQQIIYSADDVKELRKIYEIQSKTLAEQGQINTAQLEMDVLPTIMLMEYIGITLNKEKWIENETRQKELLSIKQGEILDYIIANIDFSKFDTAYTLACAYKLKVGTKKLANELRTIKGDYAVKWFRDNFNISSHVQMLNFLNLLGLNIPNTNKKTLDKVLNNPLVKLLLEYREFDKKVSTYGSKFLENINPTTGFIHTNYNQLGTVSGRFSSDSPNLQNQPQEEEWRNCYEARPGYVILNADYSQAELRGIGAITGEKEIIDAFLNGVDLHTKTASVIFRKPIEEITKDERYRGKQTNFGVSYGISPWGMYKNFNIPVDDAEVYLENYWKGYPTFTYFKGKAEEFIWENKFSVTPYGRKRFFEDKKLFRDSFEREKYIAQVKREGFNHIVQGCVADVIKMAMIRLMRENPFGLDKFRILLQTHDELTIEAKSDIIDKAVEFTREIMEGCFQPFLGMIPAKVDIIVAPYWTKKEEKDIR